VVYELHARHSRAVAFLCAVLSMAVAGCSSQSDRRQARALAPHDNGPLRLDSRPSPQSDSPRLDSPRLDSTRPAKTAGSYKIGKPYQIRGRWYVPAEDPNYDRSGVASWYGPDFHGKRTANGETFDMHGLTAAHTTLPLPSYVYVTNLSNGRTLLLRVNDRGPYVAGRIIDLSKGAARILGTEANGIGHVRVRYAGRAPLDGDDSAERQFLAAQSWTGSSTRMSLGLQP
jgi:rare lipoprotein A